MAAVLPSLVVIPIHLLQGASVVPQRVLILVHLAPQRLGVIDLVRVDVDLAPGHKDRLLVAASHLGAQPLVMEVVAHAVGCRLEHDDGLGLQGHTAAHAAHHLVGTVHRTRLPEGYLAQVGHLDVIAANGILAARTGSDHEAIAALDLLHVGLALKFGEPRPPAVEQVTRIVAQQQVVHPLDALACHMQVTADEAVPTLMAHQLHPGQVHLHQCGASPLACFEQDDAHRAARRALVLHHSEQPTLWAVEQQGHVAAAQFVLDGHAADTPVLKVLLDAPAVALQRRQRQVVGTAGEHSARHAASVGLHAVTVAALARQLVVTVGCRYCLAALVLGNNMFDRCIFHGQSHSFYVSVSGVEQAGEQQRAARCCTRE